jgi:hypothetical protein
MIELECPSRKALDGTVATLGVSVTSRSENYVHLHKPSIVNLVDYQSFYTDVFGSLAFKDSKKFYIQKDCLSLWTL